MAIAFDDCLLNIAAARVSDAACSGFGVSVNRFAMIDCGVVPENGRSPVIISYSNACKAVLIAFPVEIGFAGCLFRTDVRGRANHHPGLRQRF